MKKTVMVFLILAAGAAGVSFADNATGNGGTVWSNTNSTTNSDTNNTTS